MQMERMVAMLLSAAVLWVVVGCGSAPEPAKSETKAKGTAASTDTPDTKTKTPELEAPKAAPPKRVMPAVTLSEEDANTCLVKVGDSLPEIKLTGFDDKEHTLKDLYGSKGTVVIFWSTSKSAYSTTALEDLNHQAAMMSNKGIKMVGIHRGEKELGATAALESKIAFPQLSDVDGAALAKVATNKKLPRVYLLDANGKIVWFEMIYDTTNTSRVLEEAVKVLLGE